MISFPNMAALNVTEVHDCCPEVAYDRIVYHELLIEVRRILLLHLQYYSCCYHEDFESRQIRHAACT